MPQWRCGAYSPYPKSGTQGTGAGRYERNAKSKKDFTPPYVVSCVAHRRRLSVAYVIPPIRAQHGFFEDCRAERGLPRFIRSAFLTCPAAGLWQGTPTTQNGRMKPIPDERAYFSYAGASGTDARTTERGLRTAPIAGYTMWSFGKPRCG